MNLGHETKPLLLLMVVLTLIGGILPAQAQQVWSGFDRFFEKEDFADWTLPENQDRISAVVWLTRRDTQGLFNIAQEDSYGAGSPGDTEWAYGSAVDWASLEFQNWVDWIGGNPNNTLGLDAVVHLISEDIYLDIRFASWSGGGPGGGFSLHRASDPTPVRSSPWGVIKSLY